MNNKDKLEEIAHDILNDQTLPEDKFGSVIMVLMMISIIITIMRVMQECDKSKNIDDKVDFYTKRIHDISDRKWWFARMRLKKCMRNELSREDYKTYSASLCDAIFKKGVSITEDEVKTLLEANK